MVAESCPHCVYIQDIMREIFSRLPVKSLIRFQSLSKDCAKLFKTPSFISEHLHHSHNNPSMLFTASSIYSLSNSPEERSFYIIRSHEIDEEIKQVHSPMSNLPIHCVVGSCNGLICMYHGGKVMPQILSIWNPATKEFKRIDLPKNQILKWTSVVGFGYSAILNDYKIVILYNKVQGAYSLNTGMWRETILEDFNVDFSVNRVVSAVGAVFFLGFEIFNVANGPCLISFDIDKEVFSKTKLPPVIGHKYGIELSVYKDSVAILHTTPIDPHIVVDVWVMDEKSAIGECSTWVKLFTIRPLSISLLPYALDIWRGEILFFKQGENFTNYVLSLCNSSSNVLKELPFQWYESDLESFIYSESLVPIHN